jgi:hypothetical protein
MISSERELQQAHEALGDLYRAVAALRAELAISNPRAFALMAEGPLHEIGRLQREIQVYTGLDFLLANEVPLWLRLVGPRARWGEMPSSVLTAFLDALRKGVQSIATYDVTGKQSRRPPAEVIRACDVELVNFAPGSFQVGLRLPEPDQGVLFPRDGAPFAQVALKEFLAMAEWVASTREIADLENIFSDTTKRRVTLRAVKSFVPRSTGGIHFVELSGAALPSHEPVQLAPTASYRITKALETSIARHEETYEGEIREIDLDRQSFKLRNVRSIGEVFCRFGEDLFPIAVELLGKRVRVIGTRTTTNLLKRALKVVDIEKVDTGSDEDASKR